MHLTSFTDYSLRVLIYLANVPEGRATIAEIARAFDISEDHVVKVVHLLGHEGVLLNKRGRGGGAQLARSARDINVGEVVRLTERRAPLVECFDRRTNTCALAGGCTLQRAFGEALAAFYGALDRYSVADLHVGSRQSGKLTRRAHRAPSPYLSGKL
jgi:Rrf2 family nitric oxide-sensitive transcriptional repressor